MNRLLFALPLAAACATTSTRVPGFDSSCRKPDAPCTFSYDFEPSGAARDPFGQPGEFLVANEDALLFRWDPRAANAFRHDPVEYAFTAAAVIDKVEALTAGHCDGHPVLLLASNFMPNYKGQHRPLRERVVAIVDRPDAAPRVLEGLSAQVLKVAEPGRVVKVEGLALAPDCRTVWVGLRSNSADGVAEHGTETFVREVHAFQLDIDWAGTREEVAPADAWSVDGAGCSGQPEGISDLALLADGSFLVSTSFEATIHEGTGPSDPSEGRLAGSLWRRRPDGSVSRLACFPGHKPEALAVSPDERSVHVIFEDDDYGGRPIRAFAVDVALP